MSHNFQEHCTLNLWCQKSSETFRSALGNCFSSDWVSSKIWPSTHIQTCNYKNSHFSGDGFHVNCRKHTFQLEKKHAAWMKLMLRLGFILYLKCVCHEYALNYWSLKLTQAHCTLQLTHRWSRCLQIWDIWEWSHRPAHPSTALFHLRTILLSSH